MALFIVTLLSRAGRQTECQQATVVALQIEAAELAPLQRLAAPEAFQIKRKQFLIPLKPRNSMSLPPACRRMRVSQSPRGGCRSAKAVNTGAKPLRSWPSSVRKCVARRCSWRFSASRSASSAGSRVSSVGSR